MGRENRDKLAWDTPFPHHSISNQHAMQQSHKPVVEKERRVMLAKMAEQREVCAYNNRMLNVLPKRKRAAQTYTIEPG
jgi:hypothetical protein